MDFVLYFERENKPKLPTIIPNERKRAILLELEAYVVKEGIPAKNMAHLKKLYEAMIPKWQSDVEFLKGWLHLIKV